MVEQPGWTPSVGGGGAALARSAVGAVWAQVAPFVKLTAALTRAVTVDDVMEALDTELLGAVGAANVILVVGQEGEDPRFRSVGLSPEMAARLPGAYLGSSSRQALLSGRPAFFPSRQQHDADFPVTAQYWDQLRLAASAVLPLVVGGEALGVMRLGYHDRRAFDAEERVFLTTVADLAGQALHRAQLLADERAARRSAEAAAARARRLAALTAALSSALTIDEVAGAVEAEVRATTDADTFSLRFLTPDGRLARALSLGGVPAGYAESFAFASVDQPGALAEVVAGRQAVFVESVLESRRRFGAAETGWEALHLESVARLPLLAENELLGVLSVGYEEPRTFSPEERLFLVTVAGLTAQALQRGLRSESLRHLQGLSDVALSRLSLHDLIRDLGGRLGAALSAAAVRILVLDAERGVLAPSPSEPGTEDIAPAPGPSIPLRQGVLGRAAATRTALVVEDAGADDVLDPVLIGCRSIAAVPLVVDDRLVGVLAVGTRSSRHFGAADLELLGLAAERVAVAVDRSRAFEAQRLLARTLQAALLPPSLPDIPGVALAARYLAAGEGTEVGGDFYDVFPLGHAGSWLAIVGDVRGRGPAAAAMTGLARHTVRAVAFEETSPAALLARLNLALGTQAGDEGFATAVAARLDPGPDRLDVVLACAGHCDPVVVRAGGQVETITSARGMLLGPFDDIGCVEQRIALGPGDVLLLYTDGVLEAAGPDDRFGDQRLADVLAGAAGLGPCEIVRRVEAAVLAHCTGPCGDDLALLTIGFPG